MDKVKSELKRLSCLFNISCLNECELTKDDLLQKAVNYLPAGWQFPEIAEAAIVFNGQTYQTTNFIDTDWLLTSETEEPPGETLTIRVAYQQEMPVSDKSPFLFEERQLIDSVAVILHQKIAHNALFDDLQKMYGLWDKAYDMAGIGHWSLDLINGDLYWSKAIKKLHEVPDDYEPDLESAINFYQEGVHRETIKNAVQKAIETGTSFKIELKIITAKGNERWIRAVGKSEFKDGRCEKLYGSTQDITERKITENELKAQKERLERSQQIARMGDWEYNPQTEDVLWSPMLYEIFDLDPDLEPPDYEHITRTYFKEDKQRIDDKFKKILLQAEPHDFNVQMQTEEGAKKYLRAIGIPQTDDTGRVVKISGILQDVTKEKKMEFALQESQERLDAAVTGADLGVWDLNLSTGNFFTNDRWWEMIGFKPRKMEYSYAFFLSLLHPDDRHKPAEEIARIESGDSNRLDLTLRLRGKDGEYRTILDRGKVVEYDENGNIIRLIGTHVDISEKVELMDQVVQSAIEGEDRERKRIASDLHDGIGQYLGASNMNFESVKHELDNLSPKGVSRFNRGLRLLKRAMEETRKTAHKLMPEALEEYGLTLAVESLIESLQQTSGVNISFESTIGDSSLHQRASINIYRIIQEALNNAIVHGKSSNIIVTLHQTAHRIRCIIQDDGVGINLQDSDTETGLGLQSMRFRAHSMSGTISFDSTPHKGMTITLNIPINKNVAI